MRVALSLLLLLSLSACGSGEAPAGNDAAAEPAATAAPPTADDAKTLIAGSAAFGDYQFSTGSSFSLPVEESMMNAPARAGAKDLEKAGWIRMRNGRVELAKGEGDRRFLVREGGFIDIVPLAKKELLEVQDVRAEGDKVMVDFTWRWIANEIGESFTEGLVKERFDATHAATAELRDYGSGWEVFMITKKLE
ncbi:MAG: hypothetical protein LC732_11970 [Acidobacteria bacterium]|nr:hypothetical protein [Acidobacteriota bacterium]